MSFFHTLNYSSCNEDAITELKALDINENDVVGCITGSGDRPLHMLLNNPAKVHAFDANPIQNYLLQLKIAAIKSLNYKNFSGFIGLTDMSPVKRESLFQKLHENMTPDASAWFLKNTSKITNGILYQGRWEKYFGRSARLM